MTRRHVSIFLSSTFRDMQAERDYIKKRVLPRLRETLDAHGITIHITDLRWGVDTSGENEDDREAKVLRVCLDAIRRDRPYFIGLVGQRYGWIPSAERMQRIKNVLPVAEKAMIDSTPHSVTELEMLLGALGSADMMPHSFFFFRDKAGHDAIHPEYRSVYCDTDPDLIANVDRLRSRITDTFAAGGLSNHVTDYSFSWDNDSCRITGLEEFGEKMYQSIISDILADVETSADMSDFDIERRALQNFIATKLENFSGRHDIVGSVVSQLLAFDPLNPSRHNGYFLSGDSGSGKSAVFARVFEQLQAEADRDNRIILLGHAAGTTKISADINFMIERWNSELANTLRTGHTSQSGTDGFSRLLWQAVARGYRPIIVIDSYDSFNMPSNDYYDWERILLDFSFIPANIPFVCTTLPGKVEKYVERRESFTALNLDNFTLDEANELLDNTLSTSTKELPQHLRKLLLSLRQPDGLPAHSSPFWLSMAVSLLDELGDNDFRNIDHEKHTRDDLKINAYLQRIINSLPLSVEELFDRFIELSSQYFPEHITKTAMAFAAISEIGINEPELELLLDDEWDELQFACIARWFRRFFHRSPLTGRWQLTHNRLKEHLIAKSGTLTEQLRDRYINVLIDRLDTDDPQILDEMLFQTIRKKDVRAFAHILHHLQQSEAGFPIGQIMHWVPERISVTDMCHFCTALVNALMHDHPLLIDNPGTCDFITHFFDQSFLADMTMRQRVDMLNLLIDSITLDSLADGNPRKMQLFIELSNSFSQLFSNHPSKLVDENFERFYPIFRHIFEQHGTSILLYWSAQTLFNITLDYAKMPWKRLIGLPADERYPILEDPAQTHYHEMRRRADILFEIADIAISKSEQLRKNIVAKLDDYAKDKMGTKFLYDDSVMIDNRIAELKTQITAMPDARPQVSHQAEDHTPVQATETPHSNETQTMSESDKAYSALMAFINTEITFNADADYDRLTDLVIAAADAFITEDRHKHATVMVERLGSLFTSHLANIQFAYQAKRSTDHFRPSPRDYIYTDYRLKPHHTAAKIADWLTANGHQETAEAFKLQINPYLSAFHKFSPNPS